MHFEKDERRKSALLASACVLLGLTACAESSFSSQGYEDYAADTGASFAAESADDDGAWGASDTGFDDGLGSESENDFLQLQPIATDKYVFVANPARDTVTRIAVDDLSVITVDVGSNPQAVETTPDYKTAAVFNMGSDDVTVIDADTLETVTVEVRDHFNQMVMSPDGRWVICFNDPDAPNDQGEGGVVSFNEISLVDVQSKTHYPIVVGFNPKQIRFTEDAATAAVISDAYLALVDLSADEPDVEMVQIVDDPADPPLAEEILIAEGFAFIRQYATDALTLVDLVDGDVSSVSAGENPTDMDMGPNGEVVVVARSSQELYVYTYDDDFGAWVPEAPVPLPEDEVIGAIEFIPDSQRALLYTTASLEARYSIWDRESGAIETWGLAKPIQSLSVTPTGESLLVIHTAENASDMSSSDPFYDEHAISLIDLEDQRSNPLLLPSEPSAYAHANDGSVGYFIMEGEPYLEILKYGSLLYEEVELYSQPVHVGVLPDRTEAYVNQEHDLGRISFYSPETEVLETITGFELNSEIEH